MVYNASMKIFIIGGSRFVGPYVIASLVKARHQLTIFNRGNQEYIYPKSVLHITGDRNLGFKTKDKYDVVIDMCAYNGEQTLQVIEQLKFDFLLHFGTVASYQEPALFPVSEDQPQGKWPVTGAYGKGKAECETVLAQSGVNYASIRPTYILGKNNYLNRELFIYTHLKNNKQITIPGNGQALVQFVFADEVAQAIVRLVEIQLPGAFNCSGNDAITLTGLVEQMGKIMGVKPNIRFNPAADRSEHDVKSFPFPNENFVFDNDKMKKLGMYFRPLIEGLTRDYHGYYADLLL